MPFNSKQTEKSAINDLQGDDTAVAGVSEFVDQTLHAL